MIEWNPWVVTNLVTALVSLAMAGIVFAAGPGRNLNRWLAATFLCEGLTLGPLWAVYSAEGFRLAYAMQVTLVITFVAMQFAYLGFLAHALDLPWLRPLRRPWYAWLSVIAWAAVVIFLVARTEAWVGPPIEVPYADYEFELRPAFAVAFFTYGLLGLCAFAFCLLAMRRTRRGTTARRHAKTIALAVGIRDCVAMMSLFIMPAVAQGIEEDLSRLDYQLFIFFNVAGFSLAILAACLVTARGILKSQLYDIDLKIKKGAVRGVVGTLVIGVVLVVGQLIQNATTDTLGVVGGAIAAGLLLLAIRPLEKAATRVADAAAPRVQATPDYISVRKSEVYKAALEGAMQDGTMTDRERNVLTRLQLELGIANAEARSLEHQMARVMGVA